MPRRKKSTEPIMTDAAINLTALDQEIPASRLVPLDIVYRSIGRPAANANPVIGTNIRRFREAANLTQPQLAEMIGLSRSAVANWERDFVRPDIDRLVKLCDALNVSADDLLGIPAKDAGISADDRAMLRTFNSLNKRDRHLVNTMMNTMHEADYLVFKESFSERFKSTQLNPLKACAGSGIDLPDAPPPMQTIIRITELTSRCDEIIRITGDSMMPDYMDGDRVLLQHKPEIAVGQIGIFIVNNEGMIKEFQGDHLHSLNPDYDDIHFDEGTEVRCVGLVLGKLTPDMLPTPDEQYMINELLEERRSAT